MEYLYSPSQKILSQNKYNDHSRIIALNKENYSTNNFFKSRNENIYIKDFKKYNNYINKNIKKIKSLRVEYNELDCNYQKRELKECNDDLLIINFNDDNNINLLGEEKKINSKNNDVYSNSKLILTNREEYKTKKFINNLNNIYSRTKPKRQNNELFNSNTYLKKRHSFEYNNIIKNKNNNMAKNYNTLSKKTLIHNLTEANLKLKLGKENININSDINNYLVDEYKSKLQNEHFYIDKCNELEKEFELLKATIMDYQEQNKELKKEINNLKNKNENINLIKVNLKDINKNSDNSKDNNIELILQENIKLLKENKIYKNQIDENTKKIKNLL